MAVPRVDVDAVSALLREVTAQVVVPRFRALTETEVTSKGCDDVVTVVEARRGDFSSVGAGPGAAVAAYPGLARREVDAGLQWRTHPWVHAPGSLVLAEAGGAARRPDGRPYRPGDTGAGLVMVAHAEHWGAARDALLGPS